MKIQLLKMKADLKVLATEIRTLKSKRKELRGYVPGLHNAQYKYRARHIAYCMLRGKSLEQIENKLRDPNDPTHTHVRKEAARIVAETLNPQPTEETRGTQDLRPSGQEPVALAADSSMWSRIVKLFV